MSAEAHGNNVESADQNTDSGSLTYGQQVNAVVDQMVVDEKGNYQLPDIEMSEEVKYSANLERRRRSTESTLGKTRLQLKAKEKVNNKLVSKVTSLIQPNVSEEQLADLEALKHTDPDKWHQELSKLEQGVSGTLDTELSNLNSEASQQAIEEMVEEMITEYNSANPEVQITPEVIENQLPPAYMKQLREGTITFATFLSKANKFLKTPKTIKGTEVDSELNLGDVGGGSAPSSDAQGKQEEESYPNTIF